MAVRFGCSGQKFGKRIGIGLTNDNETGKSQNGHPLETVSVYVGVITIPDL